MQKNVLLYIYVLIALLAHSFASLTPKPEETSTENITDHHLIENGEDLQNTVSNINQNTNGRQKSNAPKSRSIPIDNNQRFQGMPHAPLDVISNPELLPVNADGPFLPDNNPDTLNYDFDENLNVPDVVYPSDDSDLAAAETGLVFRPLFAYRKQIAKRKRLYGNKQTPPRTEQRRRAAQVYYYPYEYYYGYPSHGFNYYYPRYYYEAQWDHVA